MKIQHLENTYPRFEKDTDDVLFPRLEQIGQGVDLPLQVALGPLSVQHLPQRLHRLRSIQGVVYHTSRRITSRTVWIGRRASNHRAGDFLSGTDNLHWRPARFPFLGDVRYRTMGKIAYLAYQIILRSVSGGENFSGIALGNRDACVRPRSRRFAGVCLFIRIWYHVFQWGTLWVKGFRISTDWPSEKFTVLRFFGSKVMLRTILRRQKFNFNSSSYYFF